MWKSFGLAEILLIFEADATARDLDQRILANGCRPLRSEKNAGILPHRQSQGQNGISVPPLKLKQFLKCY